MTLAQLAITVALLGVLGLVASRFGLSAIPAYLLAGLLLGPKEPKDLSIIRPSEVTEFLAQLGIVFLLFFLGLEFALPRLMRAGRTVASGGALVLAATVSVSSSAVTVKGLIYFRRLADAETDLILAILLFEALVIALVHGFAGGGGALGDTLAGVGKAVAFVGVSLAASRYM